MSRSPSSDRDATAVYAADKVARCVSFAVARPAAKTFLIRKTRARSKLEHYLASLVMLERITPDHPFGPSAAL